MNKKNENLVIDRVKSVTLKFSNVEYILYNCEDVIINEVIEGNSNIVVTDVNIESYLSLNFLREYLRNKEYCTVQIVYLALDTSTFKEEEFSVFFKKFMQIYSLKTFGNINKSSKDIVCLRTVEYKEG